MDTARIATLLNPFVADQRELSTKLLDNISTYIDLLLRWNKRINLTAIRDPEHIVIRHFGESLLAARHLFREDSGRATLTDGPPWKEDRGRAALQGRVNDEEMKGALAPAPQASKITLADIGSGAGFPGVPIKIWVPHVHVTLIESNHKKATFLRELARVLTLTDIDIQNARAEALPKASFDVVILRAVERFEMILPTAASLVAPGGRLALLIGVSQLRQAMRTLDRFSILSDVQMPESESRCLVIASKST